MSGNQFTMQVDLNVLEHLGINLYSNSPAALTEAIANAWDADAKRVDIKINLDEKSDGYIEIKDDGIGMSIDDLNTKYLCVGYRRRKHENSSKTPSGRLVMGRKGLGKLSLFSIADEIEVQSAKDGQLHGFKMSTDEIRQAIDERKSYHPIPLRTKEISIQQGTKIVLRKIKKNNLVKTASCFKKRLARRFSIIGQSSSFEVFINDEQIKPTDHVGLQKIQFLWEFEGSNFDQQTTSPSKKGTLPSNSDGKYPDIGPVKGWIGTAFAPKDLKDKDAGNINGIVILARGRLFHENILSQLNDARFYTKYLTGQIEVDFLDNDQSDIATSDRQRMQENDIRYSQLMNFLHDSLGQVQKDWSNWRGAQALKKATETSPALQEWLTSLSPEYKKSAEGLIKQLAAFPIDKEEDLKTLYKHGILAFERMKLHNTHQELAENIDDPKKLLELFANYDSLEASLYCDIVRTRLDVIKQLQIHIDNNRLEKILQKYLFDHLWLLDPAWERACKSECIETTLRKEWGSASSLTKKEKLARIDIGYRTVANKHIIIELKRSDREMKLEELTKQGSLYVDKVEKILKNKGEVHPNIEVIFVLGQRLGETKSDRIKNAMNSISQGSRVVYYDDLIQSANAAYAEYLEKAKEADRIWKIAENI